MEVTPDTTKERLLEHNGPLSEAQSEELFEKALVMVESGAIPRAAFRVFVELVQNLRLHGGASGEVSLWRKRGYVFIRTENNASKDTIEHMRAVIDFINDHAGDIQFMMRELRGVEISPFAKGAGLGLMEVRRLSGNDILVSESSTGIENNSGLVITVRLEHKF